MSSELDELDKELADLEGGEQPTDGDKKSAAKTLPIVVAAFALISFAGIVFYAYHQGVRSGSEDAAPLLTPDGMAKIQPDDPGGLEVPHQDKLVYNRVDPERDDSNVERLLPPPEDPMQPPVVEETTAAAAEATSETPPIPSIIETPDASKTETPPLPTPELEAPVSPPPTSAVEQPNEVKKPETEVTATPVAETPAVAATPTTNVAKSWRIQISAVKSDGAAKAEWTKQQKAFPDLLSNLTLQIQKVDVNGVTYHRVRGGPLKDKKSATALCDKLKAKKLACIIVKPDA